MSKEVGKMVRSRDVVQAEGSASGADGAAAGAGSLAPGQMGAGPPNWRRSDLT